MAYAESPLLAGLRLQYKKKLKPDSDSGPGLESRLRGLQLRTPGYDRIQVTNNRVKNKKKYVCDKQVKRGIKM